KKELEIIAGRQRADAGVEHDRPEDARADPAADADSGGVRGQSQRPGAKNRRSWRILNEEERAGDRTRDRPRPSQNERDAEAEEEWVENQRELVKRSGDLRAVRSDDGGMVVGDVER